MFTYIHNDHIRYTAKCFKKNCQWRIYAGDYIGISIKRMNGSDTCERSEDV